MSADESRSFGKTHSFQVQGERFSLRPQEVLKVFPPRNTLGKFDNVLPHVVLGRRTLPWERLPAPPGAAKVATSNPGSWLAVLVFPEAMAPAPKVGKLSDLFPAAAPKGDGGATSPGTLLAGIFSYGGNYASMEDFLEVGETPDDSCVYIDLPKSQFAACMPSSADLAWNAHVRSKAGAGDSFRTLYSVVVANSLPAPGQGAVAHLVSLEGLAGQLPQDDGSFAVAPAWDAVRLVSLLFWRFRVAPLEASFEHMLQGLNGGVAAQGEATTEVGDSQLRLPKGYVPGAAPAAAPAGPFDSGYTVLGGSGPSALPAAWYRGPLLPSTLPPTAADTSRVRPLLPATGTVGLVSKVSASPAQDVSWAAAWQIGRLLALADKDFATGQVSWKRDARARLNTLLGQQSEIGGGSRAAYAQLVRAVLKDKDRITQALGDKLSVDGSGQTLAIPQELVDWLGRLAQLQLLPFDYLVPDSGMFPPESLRFVSVDPCWLACLLDGAWSLGRQPAAQWAFDTAYQPWQQLLDGSLSPSFASGGQVWPWSGVLLNSEVIPGYWPGIEFETTPEANILREDRLGPGTLLLLFDKALETLTLKQPSEGIHFGFEIDGRGALSKSLRYVEIGGRFYPTPPDRTTVASGQEAPAAFGLATVPQRSATVIQMDKLASAIAATLGVPASPGLMPVDFAVELVESVSSVKFELPPVQEG